MPAALPAIFEVVALLRSCLSKGNSGLVERPAMVSVITGLLISRMVSLSYHECQCFSSWPNPAQMCLYNNSLMLSPVAWEGNPKPRPHGDFQVCSKRICLSVWGLRTGSAGLTLGSGRCLRLETFRPRLVLRRKQSPLYQDPQSSVWQNDFIALK